MTTNRTNPMSQMTCEEFELLLSEPGEKSREAEAHALACARCAVTLRVLRAAAREAVAPEEAARLEALVFEARGERRSRHGRALPVGLGLALAAGLLTFALRPGVMTPPRALEDGAGRGGAQTLEAELASLEVPWDLDSLDEEEDAR